MSEKIKRQRDYLEGKMAVLTKALVNLRASCPHENVIKVYKSNTGNYDPSADSYWINFNCPDCGKRWEKDQ